MLNQENIQRCFAESVLSEVEGLGVTEGRNKMPDVDSYESSSGIAVDVQQRLNCALS